MFRLGGLRVSGKAVWINAWWYGAYRCIGRDVLLCCGKGELWPWAVPEQKLLHSPHWKVKAPGMRSRQKQRASDTRPDPTRPSRTWKVTCHKHKCQSAAGHHREVKHRCHPWLLLLWIWRQRRFLTFILIKSVQINVSFMFNLGTIIN